MTQARRGADMVMETLRAHGVDTIFTLSGNHIMELFDAALPDAGPRLIHTRHEAAAVHMADAKARLDGTTAVAMVTGGPGHANAVGALFTAVGADSPVLLLSGHAPTTQIGQGAFQELAQAEMAAPVAKASWMAERTENLADDVTQALRIAASGRPGPVHLSLPSNLIEQAVGDDAKASASQPGGHASAGDPAQWQTCREMIAQAKRPVILAGPVFARAELKDQLIAVAAELGMPWVLQESPRGLNDPRVGAFAEILPSADLGILASKAMDFTVGFGKEPAWHPETQVIAISADPAQRAFAARREASGKTIAIDADAPAVLAALKTMSGAAKSVEDGWVEKVREAVAYRPASWLEPQVAKPGTMHPLDMCAAIKPFVDANADSILITDGGEIGQWAQATLTARRQITNSVTGSIGASLPFAIAARTVEPEAPVVTIMGDGTVGFHLAEFETAVRHGLPFVAVVGNDQCWNAEHQIQLRDYGADRAHGCELEPAAYHKVCEALGGFGAYASTRDELAAAMEAAIASAKPACINVALDGRAAPSLRRQVA